MVVETTRFPGACSGLPSADHAFGRIKASIEAIVKVKEVLLIEKRAEGSGVVMVTIKVN